MVTVGHRHSRARLIGVTLRHCSDTVLTNFYQLSVLYKLCRTDAGFASIRSHCLPPMSATTLPSSPPPSVEPDQVHLSLPPSIQPEVKTPERERSASRLAPNTTSLSHGSPISQRQESDTDWFEESVCEDYEDCVREDLRSRVFVDFEVFMNHVLHVPGDWKSQWGPAIEAVKADDEFKKHHKEYRKRCKSSFSRESSLYETLMNAVNAVFDVLSPSKSDGVSTIPQYHHPGGLPSEVNNQLHHSSDLVIPHKDPKPSAGEESLRLANPLHIFEAKPCSNALCDGANMPRLVVEGTRAMSSPRFWP